MKLYQKPFSLAKNLFDLEQTIIQTKAILVILDPLTAVPGHSIDSSRDQGIREIFTPLALLAESTNCAFLVVRHLKKGSSDNLLYRGAGSIGIIAAARTCLTIFYDPPDEKNACLLSQKAISPTHQKSLIPNSANRKYGSTYTMAWRNRH